MTSKLLLFLLLFPTTTFAESLGTTYPVDVLDVVDGDTIHVKATIWIKTYKDTSVRIYGIDTPEIRGKCDNEKYLASQAKKFVETKLAGADSVYISNVRSDKYGNRVVADVLYKSGKKTYNLGHEMLKNKLAVHYYGGTKTNYWCDDLDENL